MVSSTTNKNRIPKISEAKLHQVNAIKSIVISRWENLRALMILGFIRCWTLAVLTTATTLIWNPTTVLDGVCNPVR